MSASVFLSPLSIQDCVARLRESVDSDWEAFGSKSVCGRVGDATFRLRERINYRNSFQTNVFGKLEPIAEGTLIRCRFGMHRFVVAFMILWFGILMAIGAKLAVTILTRQSEGSTAPIQWTVPLTLVGLLICGAALIRFGRLLARDEQRFLGEFICTVLAAKEADQGRHEATVLR